MWVNNNRIYFGFLSIFCFLISSFLCQDDNSTEQHLDKRALSKCFDDLGCFSITSDFFHAIRRPINLLPNDRESINTKFLLYTRKNIKQFHILRAKDRKSIDTSDFNVAHDTKIIIHGYIDNQLFGEWMRQMKDEFLMHGEYNVILVDWSGGNKLPYSQAASNTRVVGAEIALLVNYLKDNYGLSPEKVHILGHSLGGHISGYAGERIPNLSRITAMDPAEPFFEGLPTSVRIDPSDAKFVDVIHSDSKSILLLGFGMSDLVGHIDFFPNDGNAHPGCDIKGSLWSIVTTGLSEGARRFVSCNHQRSIDFMTDSINNHQCEMVGRTCSSWQSFLSGNCVSCGANSEKCAIVGLRSIESKEVFQAKGNPGKLYFQTSDKSPFCLFHYRVTVKMEKGTGTSKTGQLKLTLKGHKREDTLELGKDNQTYKPGEVYNFLITTQKDLGTIEGLSVSWKVKKLITLFKHGIHLSYVRVTPLAADSDAEMKKKELWFCDKKLNPIETGTKISLFKKDSCL